MRRQLNIRVSIRDLARWREQAKIERRSLTNLIELSVAEHIFGYRLSDGPRPVLPGQPGAPRDRGITAPGRG